MLAAIGRPDVAPLDMPEAIRLWQQAEATDAPSGGTDVNHEQPQDPPRRK